MFEDFYKNTKSHISGIKKRGSYKATSDFFTFLPQAPGKLLVAKQDLVEEVSSNSDAKDAIVHLVEDCIAEYLLFQIHFLHSLYSSPEPNLYLERERQVVDILLWSDSRHLRPLSIENTAGLNDNNFGAANIVLNAALWLEDRSLAFMDYYGTKRVMGITDHLRSTIGDISMISGEMLIEYDALRTAYYQALQNQKKLRPEKIMKKPETFFSKLDWRLEPVLLIIITQVLVWHRESLNDFSIELPRGEFKRLTAERIRGDASGAILKYANLFGEQNGRYATTAELIQFIIGQEDLFYEPDFKDCKHIQLGDEAVTVRQFNDRYKRLLKRNS